MQRIQPTTGNQWIGEVQETNIYNYLNNRIPLEAWLRKSGIQLHKQIEIVNKLGICLYLMEGTILNYKKKDY